MLKESICLLHAHDGIATFSSVLWVAEDFETKIKSCFIDIVVLWACTDIILEFVVLDIRVEHADR
jgi:hypothetical protein